MLDHSKYLQRIREISVDEQDEQAATELLGEVPEHITQEQFDLMLANMETNMEAESEIMKSAIAMGNAMLDGLKRSY